MEVLFVTSQEERRLYRRVENQVNVRLAREDNANELKDVMIDVAKSVNISANGMLIHTKERLSMQEVISVMFLKPNSFEFFEGLGRVVRVETNNNNAFMVGLHFFNLSPSELNNLNYYLNMRNARG
jgi:c-di-GMP-binding flagellar brake protein YcgR